MGAVRTALTLTGSIVALLAAPSARAQAPGGFGTGAPVAGPLTSSMPNSETTPESQDKRPKESQRSVKLFDSRHVVQSFELDMGPIAYRRVGEDREAFHSGTGEILAGVAITTSWKPFYLTGMQAMHLRAFDAKSFAWTLLGSHLAAGVRLGPIEPEARIGLGLVTVDVFHGEYSAELLTPRVAAGVGIHLGQIRLDIETHSEYLWRWFGPDYLIRGVSVGLRLDVPRPKGPSFSESPQSP